MIATSPTPVIPTEVEESLTSKGGQQTSNAKRRTSNVEPKTPELDKMHAVKDRSQAIGEFLEWLQQEKELELAQWDGNRLFVFNYSIEKLLAEFFEIDLNKVDDEKRMLLEMVRRAA